MSRSRFYTGRHFEPWFERRFSPGWPRLVAKLVILAVVFSVIGFVGGVAIDKAVGASAVSRTTKDHRARAVERPEVPPPPDPSPPRLRGDQLDKLYKNSRAARAV